MSRPIPLWRWKGQEGAACSVLAPVNTVLDAPPAEQCPVSFRGCAGVSSVQPSCSCCLPDLQTRLGGFCPLCGHFHRPTGQRQAGNSPARRREKRCHRLTGRWISGGSAKIHQAQPSRSLTHGLRQAFAVFTCSNSATHGIRISRPITEVSLCRGAWRRQHSGAVPRSGSGPSSVGLRSGAQRWPLAAFA